IDVAVDRPGLIVRARKTYTIETENQRGETRVTATLLTETSYAHLAVTPKKEPPSPEKTGYPLPLRIGVPARSLTCLPDGDRGDARVSFYFAAVNDKGEKTPISRTEQTLSIPLNESRSGRLLRVRIPVHLGKGISRIVVNVRDDESGRMGTA